MFKLSIRDVKPELNDTYVAKGNSQEEVMNNALNHLKKAHNMSNKDFTEDMKKTLMDKIEEVQEA
jgi:predicted small metal-binding protein